jgi:rhodanese-related sulfurtransferase
MRTKLLLVFILVLFVSVVPVAFAGHGNGHGNEDNGDHVACAINSGAPIPPGHFAIIAKYADKYLSGVPGRTVMANKLMDGVDDFANPYDELSDFFVLDIRSAKDYAIAHVPGAINVPFALIAKPENLIQYPTDRPILVVCYTGHTASMTSSILNTLGFDAWALRNGWLAWGSAVTVITGGNYPTEP